MRSLIDHFLTVEVTLGTAGQKYVVVPDGGKVVKAFSVISAALTTADETLTLKNAAGSSMGTIALTQSGSAAGDVDTLEPTSNNIVNEGEVIEVETDGGNAATTQAVITLVIRR